MTKTLRKVMIEDASGKIQTLYCAVDNHRDVETILEEHFEGYKSIRSDSLVLDGGGLVYLVTI
jgi:hypothetical protein